MTTEVTVERLLGLVCQQLGMEAAFIGRIGDGQRTLCYVNGAGLEPGDSDAAEESYCQLIVDGEISHAIPDVGQHPRLMALPVTGRLGIGSYLGLPLTLSDGSLYGTVCAYGSKANPNLQVADVGVLKLVAALIADRIEEDVRLERERAAQAVVIQNVLDEGQPHMVFQPIVEIATGKPAGYEALARFASDPYRTPELWVAEAARVGLGVELELQAIENALELAQTLPPDRYVAVNASPDVIVSGRLPAVLAAAAERETVIELTEHREGATLDLAAPLAELKELGYRLAMDDIGAGYSGLTRLLALRPQMVKLDRDIITGIDADVVRSSMVAAAVAFASATAITLVAEGVETEAEAATLQSLGVRFAQGYLFGRPESAPE